MGIEEFLLQRAEKVGIEKGIKISRERETTAFVKRLLALTDFGDEKIASVAFVNVEFVKKVKSLPE